MTHHDLGAQLAVAMPPASSETLSAPSLASTERKVSGRASTHLKTTGLAVGRLGSRSPNSIPSSPTSVYAHLSVPFVLM
jgi:hypothetical protein